MGFSTEEIISYYENSGKADELLATLEEKLSVLQQQVTEMRLRSHDVPDMSLSITEIPETVCCVRKYQGPLLHDNYHALYDFLHECTEKGIALAPKPFFSIHERTDYLEGKLSHTPCNSYACIPVLSEQAPEDAVHIPACTALSLISYGDYSNFDEAHLYLSEQLHKRGLTPAGYLQVIVLVAPYVGREINPQRYSSQLM